jgi:VWFA-related protein
MKCNAVIGLLILPLLAQDVRRPADDAPVFRDEARFIKVDVQVLAHDKSPLVDLTRQDFEIFDDGKSQEVASLDFDEAPLDIMLLLDISGSTVEVASEMEAQSAEAIRHLRKQDRIGLAVFAWTASLVVPITADRDQLKAGISNKSWRKGVDPKVPTELNANTLATAEYLRNNARPGARRVLIVLTDNQGTRAVSDDTVRYGLWKADVLLSTIFFNGAPDRYQENADLGFFVHVTGGEVLKAAGSDLRLGEMFDRLRKRYLLLYRAPRSKIGKQHTIRVNIKTDMKGIVIRARTGYQAIEPGSDEVTSAPLGPVVSH